MLGRVVAVVVLPLLPVELLRPFPVAEDDVPVFPWFVRLVVAEVFGDLSVFVGVCCRFETRWK